jgi:beta-N-acetylhexosaminidase
VVFPGVDEKPATMSRRWLTGILRGELGFRGAIVSDDLDMKAVAERFPVEKTVVESLMAGCDCFLACRDVAVQQKAEDALNQADPARLEEALRRFRSLRATLRRPPPPDSWRALDLAAHAACATSV